MTADIYTQFPAGDEKCLKYSLEEEEDFTAKNGVDPALLTRCLLELQRERQARKTLKRQKRLAYRLLVLSAAALFVIVGIWVASFGYAIINEISLPKGITLLGGVIAAFAGITLERRQSLPCGGGGEHHPVHGECSQHDFLLAYTVTLSSQLLAKYIARDVNNVTGMTASSVVGAVTALLIRSPYVFSTALHAVVRLSSGQWANSLQAALVIAGSLLPSPYREFSLGAGFIASSSSKAFTLRWEGFIALLFVILSFAFRPFFLGIGGKLGATAYLAGHLSAVILVLFGQATWDTATLNPEYGITNWTGIWLFRYDSLLLSMLSSIGMITACGLSASFTLWFHVHHSANPVTASSVVSLAASVFLPPSTNPLMLFIWTGSFVASLLLAKYVAQDIYGINGVASASVIGILAGLTLSSPYRETAYGASFVSASTNDAFTLQWEPFVCFVFICVTFSLRHVLHGIGGKLGMMAYVAGHISALFIVLVQSGTWTSTSLDPDDAFQSWTDRWFHSYADGNVLISTMVTISFVVACAVASAVTLWLHLYFNPHFSPVVASAMVSLAAGLFLPPSTNPLMLFIWTGSFVGMSGPAASPGSYSLISINNKPILSDIISIFITGDIGGRYGFAAFLGCFSIHLLTKLLHKVRHRLMGDVFEESGEDSVSENQDDDISTKNNRVEFVLEVVQPTASVSAALEPPV
ncbi:hypothetical protein FOL47_006524 [Perkinsus chesapeaki]|uniref:Uncharacterized protein n=1 Tax=Perkinsus chesapeaki TaxID=330153 RepID=A0A7J6LRB4_PERCH|nr:hypothetical protein FOL47_006524 [Perkinsus chesapeaki]